MAVQDNAPPVDGQAEEIQRKDHRLVIERSSDPLVLLANILEVAGAMAAQWGEEIILHLRVAALWERIGRREKCIRYLTNLGTLHSVDAYHLGSSGVKYRLDMMRYFLGLLNLDDAIFSPERLAEKAGQNKMVTWVKHRVVGKLRGGGLFASSMLSTEDEELVQVILRPIETWLQQVFLIPIPGDTREQIARELNSIKEYDNPDEIEQKLLHLFDSCRFWHERQIDTPVWVHELDDIGPRCCYLAVIAQRPTIISTYVERCIDALNERPLALMSNVALAIGGLAFMAKKLRRDELLHKGLDYLPRFPEHEQCLSALSLCEALVGY